MKANGTVVLESSLKNKNCKKCKRTLINGVKCINCESYYHASCARNCSFIKTISDDLITCCESSVKTVSNLKSDNDQAFFDAIGQLSPERKVDISIFTYVVKQKDLIIDELRQKIKMLNEKIDQLKNVGKVSTTKTAESKKVMEKVSYAKKHSRQVLRIMNLLPREELPVLQKFPRSQKNNCRVFCWKLKREKSVTIISIWLIIMKWLLIMENGNK
ncbi:hypothetical protein JTB14_008011 [Gonioctena quinquepunctata]|nr:hypothetical protein JTB14_008011 [Gonioctena quinquepunctata]